MWCCVILLVMVERKLENQDSDLEFIKSEKLRLLEEREWNRKKKNREKYKKRQDRCAERILVRQKEEELRLIEQRRLLAERSKFIINFEELRSSRLVRYRIDCFSLGCYRGVLVNNLVFVEIDSGFVKFVNLDNSMEIKLRLLDLISPFSSFRIYEEKAI